MTNSNEVTFALKMINNAYPNVSDLVLEWLGNDIIKKKLAQAYDDWMNGINDHGLPLTLAEHIVNFINNYYVFGKEIFQW